MYTVGGHAAGHSRVDTGVAIGNIDDQIVTHANRRADGSNPKVNIFQLGDNGCLNVSIIFMSYAA